MKAGSCTIPHGRQHTGLPCTRALLHSAATHNQLYFNDDMPSLARMAFQ